MAKIGVQMMMLREVAAKEGVYNTLKKLHDLGFSCVEVSQIPMTPENVAEIKRASEEFNIEIATLSASVEPMAPGMEALSTHFDKIVADCKTLNCNFLRIGILPFKYLGSMEKSISFAKLCDEYATKLAEHGIKLYYHNHHSEFIKYNGKYLLDLLRDNTEKIGFEIDVFWVQRGGENPVEFIKSYKGKLELLHLKDYKIVEPNFEGVDMTNMPAVFKAFEDVVRFAEVGEGSLDFVNIIKTGIETGAKYLFIEQDDTYGKDPFECLALSKANLVKLGFGDLI